MLFMSNCYELENNKVNKIVQIDYQLKSEILDLTFFQLNSRSRVAFVGYVKPSFPN